MRIGKKVFKYKKDALNYYKQILNSYNLGEELNVEDKVEVLALLKNHPNFEQKYCKGISKIIVDKVKYNSKAFHILNEEDLTLEAFSYIKCINGEKPPLTIFSNTCRNVVQDDINKVKFQYFSENSKGGKVKCQESGDLCVWEELVIDHRQPNTFSVIVDRFIELNSIDIKSVEYVEITDGVCQFKDNSLSDKFRIYHKEKANLRIIKKNRNSKRAYQARIKQQKKDLKIT